MATIHETPAAAEAIRPVVFPFVRAGFRHALLARVGSVCLVERTATHPASRGSVHWEVVVLRVRAARVLPNGTLAVAAEQYPPTARWGVAGWTYTSHAAASVVFAALATPRGDPARALARARRVAARGGCLHKNRPSGGESGVPDDAASTVLVAVEALAE